MNEDFQLGGDPFPNPFYVRKAQLSGQVYPPNPLPHPEIGRAAVGDVGLGGEMNAEFRGKPFNRRKHSWVGDNHPIGTAFDNVFDFIIEFVHVRFMDKTVYRYIDPHSTFMGVTHRMHQIVARKGSRPCPQAETAAQINGIGAIMNSGDQLFETSRRGKELWHGWGACGRFLVCRH
jgi:hypothetical protein